MTLDEQLYWMTDMTDCAADGDEEALLSPSAALAAALTARLREPLGQRRAEVVGALALYHAARCAALPLGDAVDDQQLAFRYFAELDGVAPAPEPAPEPLTTPAVEPFELMERWTRLNKVAERSGRPDDLAAVAAAARDLVRVDVGDSEQISMLAGCACVTLIELAESTGDVSAAREAVAAGARAVAHAPTRQDRADALGVLAHAHLVVFQLSGRTADVDPIISTTRELLSACSTDDVETLRMAHGELAECYRMRSTYTGSADDIETSLHHHRQALEITPERHSDRSMYLVNYVTALSDRASNTGSVRHLREALRLGRTIRGSAGDPERDVLVHIALYNVCQWLSFEDHDQALFDEGLEHIRAAARIGGVDPQRRRDVLARLAGSLIDAYGRRMPEELEEIAPGVLTAEQRRSVPRTLRKLLDEAVAAGTEAVRLPSYPRDVCTAHATVASALTWRFVLNGEKDDLHRAVEEGRVAVDVVEVGNVLRPLPLDVLARALRLRYAVTGDPDAVSEAVALWREAMELEVANVEFRVLCGTGWTEAALTADQDPEDALAACTATLDAFAAIAGRGTVRGDVERRLARWNGIAGNAAVAAVRAGRPGRALELLEYGRTQMWNRLLDDRSELDGLRLVDPDLADEVEMLRAELDVAHADGTGDSVGAAERIAVLGRRWDDLVDRVRAAGFTDFMRPPDLDRLLRRTWRGPVVVLSATQFGSHALVARPSGVQVVDLPGLKLREAVERTSAYLDALYGPSPDEATLHEVHAWMWRVIAEPVLDALGPPASGEAPRLWWCPTGVLGLLPLHAAARAPGDAPGSVLGRVVSSYTASVRSLPVEDGPSASRVLADGGRILFVGMGRTPGAADLSGVADEEDIVRHVAGDRVDAVLDQQARQAVVSEAIARYPLLHYSGHGVQRADDPSSGGLVLTDGVLSVARLATAHNRGGALAVLSACQTAAGGLVNPDEAITLATALQFGGWRAVVGTLWPVGDAVAVKVTRRFYEVLLDPAGSTPAHALHEAVRGMRYPNHPSMWAPFIHVGA